MPGSILPKIARASISNRLGFEHPEPAFPAEFLEPGATFVTLTLEGMLRGCIGSLAALRPIVEDTRQNALAAAFGDPRFPPLGMEEHERIRIEVSLLSEPEPVFSSGEQEALSLLRPGVDGIVFQCGARRSTFLPQVWESLPEPADFLSQLKRKAGFPEGFWSQEVRLFRYSVTKWKES